MTSILLYYISASTCT